MKLEATPTSELIEQLRESSTVIRRGAREELQERGDEALPQMLEALAHREFRVRWEITKALGEMRRPMSVPALLRALDDEEPDVRWLAAVALARIGEPALGPLLEALIHRAGSTAMRQGAHHMLSIYRNRELREPLMELRDALGPQEDPSGAVVAANRVLEEMSSR